MDLSVGGHLSGWGLENGQEMQLITVVFTCRPPDSHQKHRSWEMTRVHNCPLLTLCFALTTLRHVSSLSPTGSWTLLSPKPEQAHKKVGCVPLISVSWELVNHSRIFSYSASLLFPPACSASLPKTRLTSPLSSTLYKKNLFPFHFTHPQISEMRVFSRLQ